MLANVCGVVLALRGLNRQHRQPLESAASISGRLEQTIDQISRVLRETLFLFPLEGLRGEVMTFVTSAVMAKSGIMACRRKADFAAAYGGAAGGA